MSKKYMVSVLDYSQGKVDIFTMWIKDGAIRKKRSSGR